MSSSGTTPFSLSSMLRRCKGPILEIQVARSAPAVFVYPLLTYTAYRGSNVAPIRSPPIRKVQHLAGAHPDSDTFHGGSGIGLFFVFAYPVLKFFSFLFSGIAFNVF